MTRPAGSVIPSWAKDTLYSSGVDSGLATKLEPTSGEKSQGFHRRGRPPARKVNWLLGKIGQWLDYLMDVPLTTWHPWITTDTTPAAIELTNLRGDGTVKPCFCGWLASWIVPGSSDTTYYVGTDHFVSEQPHGVGSPPKTSVALSTSTGRLFLFEYDPSNGVNPRVLRSAALDATSWAAVDMGGEGTVTIGSVIADALMMPSGRIVACGGVDVSNYTWTSDDDGATWAVSSPLTFQPTSMLLAGTRLFMWGETSATTLWYSDDEGDTWAETPSTGFDKIRYGAYVPSEGTYAFCTGDGEFIWTTNPVTTPCTLAQGGNGAACMLTGGDGGLIATSAFNVVTPTAYLRAFSGDGGRTWHFAGNTRGDSVALAYSETAREELLGQFCNVAAHISGHKYSVNMAAYGRGR